MNSLIYNTLYIYGMHIAQTYTTHRNTYNLLTCVIFVSFVKCYALHKYTNINIFYISGHGRYEYDLKLYKLQKLRVGLLKFSIKNHVQECTSF